MPALTDYFDQNGNSHVIGWHTYIESQICFGSIDFLIVPANMHHRQIRADIHTIAERSYKGDVCRLLPIAASWKRHQGSKTHEPKTAWCTRTGRDARIFAAGGFPIRASTRGAGAAQCGSTGTNTQCGTGALTHNTTGIDNSAFGVNALTNNTSGFENTASGLDTLEINTTGFENTASGYVALANNTIGNDNTASGLSALFSNTTGSNNIGLGYQAGSNIVAGNNNIEIGNPGHSGDNKTIRIGLLGTQNKTYIAGISGTRVSGTVVEVNGNGQLGVMVSSARYKRDIRDMGNASAGLMKLRPVSFRYKNDPTGTLEYGLVAEEVKRVYPNLVTYGPDGKLQSVRYLEFTALLLNELQKQASQVQELAQRLKMKDQQLAAQQREIDALKQTDASINALNERLAALEQQVRTATPQGLRSLASK